jgi:hypothetical protein
MTCHKNPSPNNNYPQSGCIEPCVASQGVELQYFLKSDLLQTVSKSTVQGP